MAHYGCSIFNNLIASDCLQVAFISATYEYHTPLDT